MRKYPIGKLNYFIVKCLAISWWKKGEEIRRSREFVRSISRLNKLDCSRHQGLYSQHFIFFVTYDWAHLARIFVPDMSFQPSVIKHSSLLGSFLICEENEKL